MRWVGGEAARNLLSGTTHALRYALVLALVLGALVAAEVATVDELLTRAAAYRASGGSVLTLEAVGQVDGRACEAIGELPGVRAAGALRTRTEPLVSTLLPRGPVAAYSVTPGLLEVVGARQVATPGVVLADDVAESLGLSARSTLVTTAGTTTVRGTYAWPDDGRRAGFGYAALVPDDTGVPYDQCWVEAWPVPTDLANVLRSTLLPAPDGMSEVRSSRLNTSLGAHFDGEALYTGRVTRYAAVAGLVAGLLVGLASALGRRLELASARHVGVTRRAQHAQVLVESSVWVLAGGVLAGAAAAATIARAGGHDDGALVLAAAHVVVPGLLGALLGPQLAVAVTQESHLFRYFKSR
ncbi:conserved hypothetical protein [Cellulomonas flavigena DSM 20109]|uniref:ABC3 transporter permease protein domain-containing protein n=1 Tax=Cellulomonas flavigena (strain ATCC 482 / DSM 20109 / BCRC 11376 / JCM 18109 / NBRC 3775 / NCIMB 8073 / NRS 134) TaxID=446466 RepID=D5UFR1_CELFN|nr:hypothetical protein [Cellulomonas flavigena]ADG73020.1 conserved hypothetical protein [Cellulomonas flavigena DSM 20109]